MVNLSNHRQQMHVTINRLLMAACNRGTESIASSLTGVKHIKAYMTAIFSSFVP